MLTHVQIVIGDEIEPGNVLSNTIFTVSGAVGTDPKLNLMSGLRPPEPSYGPQNHAERSRIKARAPKQGIKVSGLPDAAHIMQEQDIGVRSDDHEVEDSKDIAAGNARRDNTVEPAGDKSISGTAAQTPGDAIRQSLDA